MNVLLIAIDTLRADHLGCYGYPRPTSPNLDRLAGDGVVFNDFIAPHIPTHPGYTTMFTGKDTFTHRIVAHATKLELDPKIKMLAEILSANGYFTAAADNLGRWFRRGFDLYEGYNWDTSTATAPWDKAGAVSKAAHHVLDACELEGRPWFAFLHYWEPHTPYLPPPPYDRMFYDGDETDVQYTSAIEMMHDYPAFQDYFESWMPGLRDVEFPKAQYDAEIAYCDARLAEIFSHVRRMVGGEDTLVIITSDHGEELDEHKMWFDHHGLYDTNLCVPLIIAHPDLPKGLRIDGLTTHLDLPVTILNMLGLDGVAEQNLMEGKSLLPLIGRSTDVCGTTDCVFNTENAWRKARGFRTLHHKFIHNLEDGLHGHPLYELYSLSTDPGEQTNLADSLTTLCRGIAHELVEYISRREAESGMRDPQLTEPITLTSVGSMAVAVPNEEGLVALAAQQE